MTPDRVAVPGRENSRRRITPGETRSRRLLMIAVALSVLVHLLSVGAVILLAPVAPAENNFDNQGAVELLMVERKGATPSQPGQPDTAAPQAAEPPAAAPATAEKAEPAQAEKSVPMTPSPDSASEPVPAPPSPPAAATAAATPQPPRPERAPSPPKAVDAPVFDFAGTDSDTNATVMSGRVLPAMPDDRFRNRPPAYPSDAAMRGETGTVLVIIHVAANGYATGAEVAESSGSTSLDRAAVTAVRKWRFRPAMKGGLAVPFDMPFRFVFSAN
jgi:periplasmic protein TonB